MMLAEDQALVPVEVGPVLLQLVLQQVLQEQLLPQPHRDRHLERFVPARREREVGLQQALELEQWLVVKRDQVDLVEADARLRQAVLEGVAREARIVLLARKALLLRRGHDLAVGHHRGRGVVVESRDSYDPHR